MRSTNRRLAAIAAAGGLALVGFAAPAAQAQAPDTHSVSNSAARLTGTGSDEAVAPAVTYADRLIRAWGAGHRHAAARLATTRVVQRLFDYSDPGGAHWRRTGAQGAAGTIYVTYHDDARGGNLTVGVSDVRLEQGLAHAVRQARFRPAHVITAPAYADQLIRAWGAGKHGAAERYGTKAVVRKLFRHADPGGTHWRRVLFDGTAGTIYVTYQDAHGGYLTVGVSDVGLAAGQTRDVYEARFSR